MQCINTENKQTFKLSNSSAASQECENHERYLRKNRF